MKFAQFVMGPAGCGKSTYCHIVQEHFKCALRRTCRVINLDPAAEAYPYECDIDIRDLISLDDVMEELEFGPNGGLVYAMEYFAENMNWMQEQLQDYMDDDYILFDCPGQIELYSHLTVMRQTVDMLQTDDFRVVGVYCLDINFIEDASKYLSGGLAALTAMINLELPHINILTKCDLLPTGADIARFMEGDTDTVLTELKAGMHPRYKRLNDAMGQLLDEFSLVNFVALDRDDEDSIELVLAHVNQCIQYGEDLEPNANWNEVNDGPDDE